MIRFLQRFRARYLRAKLRAMDARGEQSSAAYAPLYRAVVTAETRAGWR